MKPLWFGAPRQPRRWGGPAKSRARVRTGMHRSSDGQSFPNSQWQVGIEVRRPRTAPLRTAETQDGALNFASNWITAPAILPARDAGDRPHRPEVGSCFLRSIAGFWLACG